MKKHKRQIYCFNNVYHQKTLAPSVRFADGVDIHVDAWLWANLPKMIYKATAEDIYWILKSPAKNEKASACICSCHGRQCNG